MVESEPFFPPPSTPNRHVALLPRHPRAPHPRGRGPPRQRNRRRARPAARRGRRHEGARPLRRAPQAQVPPDQAGRALGRRVRLRLVPRDGRGAEGVEGRVRHAQPRLPRRGARLRREGLPARRPHERLRVPARLPQGPLPLAREGEGRREGRLLGRRRRERHVRRLAPPRPRRGGRRHGQQPDAKEK